MDQKRIYFITTTLFLAITFPMTLVFLSRVYTTNITNGLELIFLIAVIVGLITPSLILSWLIIISTLITIGFLFLGYIVMPTFSKIILLIAFPIETSLVNKLANFIIPWSFIVGKKKNVKNFLSHYDFTLNLQTTYNAKKLYRRQIKILKTNPHLNLNTRLLMIRWENHQQFKEMHPQEYQTLLKQMAHVFKTYRLTEEFIYYLGNATFLINSPNLDPDIFTKVNRKTKTELSKLPQPIPTHLKITHRLINIENVAKYSTPEKMLKHLSRELETTLIVEYLKEATNE